MSNDADNRKDEYFEHTKKRFEDMEARIRNSDRSLGYMDYTVVTAESMFEMNRPTVGPDGAVQAPPKTWDGVYR